MFSYLRYFVAISMVLVFVAAYLIGVYFRETASVHMTTLAQGTSQSVAQFYATQVWPRYAEDIKRFDYFTKQGKIKTVAEWGRYKDYFPFRDETLTFFNAQPVILAALQTADGSLILSSRVAGGEILSTDTEGTTLLAKAMQGESTYRLLENYTIYDAQGQSRRGSVIQTFVPLRDTPQGGARGSGAVIAVLQLQYDITAQSTKLVNLQYLSTGGIIAIFFVLIIVLFISMQRAEAIITKQHELNMELAAAVSAAEAENRDKSQFLANISHELRTPLNAIIGFSEILKNDASIQLTNQHREYLEDIHGSGKHLLSLINDILDFSKAEAGKLEVDVSELDAIKLVKNSLRLVIPRAEQAQVTLIEDLPTKHFILQTDAKKMKQVLLNLLSNSVKFTPAGGEVRVSCWHNPETDKVTFEIKDTGVGIAQKDLARVMTPFGQADSTLSRRFEGTGLGLPLSKKFVEIMGGKFTLTSEVNKGTTVTLLFPRIFDREAASKISALASSPVDV